MRFLTRYCLGPTDKAETLTWNELRGKVAQAANLFRSLGIGEKDVVAYLLPNANETAVTLLGAMTAGIANPVNPLLEPEQIAAILRETGAKVLVTLKSFPKTDVPQKAAEGCRAGSWRYNGSGGRSEPVPDTAKVLDRTIRSTKKSDHS